MLTRVLPPCARGALLALALAAGAPAAAEPVLSAMAGEWIGRGQLRETADAPNEPVYCRIRGQFDSTQTLLEQSGRCVAGNRTQGFVMRIELAGSDYRMELSGRDTGRPITLVGRRQGERIVFRSADASSAEQISSLDLEFLVNGHRMTMTRREAQSDQPFTSARIDFTKRR